MGREVKMVLNSSMISCGLKDSVTYETVSSNWKRAKRRQKENGSHQVSLLYLSFLTKVACVVAMGTDLRGRNQWIKNKSEKNNNKLDLPPVSDLSRIWLSIADRGERRNEESYPERNLLGLVLVGQAIQFSVTTRLINESLEHFPLRGQLAVITGSGVKSCNGFCGGWGLFHKEEVSEKAVIQI